MDKFNPMKIRTDATVAGKYRLSRKIGNEMYIRSN